jgi:hypothetical protein
MNWSLATISLQQNTLPDEACVQEIKISVVFIHLPANISNTSSCHSKSAKISIAGLAYGTFGTTTTNKALFSFTTLVLYRYLMSHGELRDSETEGFVENMHRLRYKIFQATKEGGRERYQLNHTIANVFLCTLKETVSWDRFQIFWKKFTELGLT